MTKEPEDKLLTAAEVAAIWNKRARDMGYRTNYTRFSVAARRTRGKQTFTPDVETALGNLYRESRAWTIALYPKALQRIADGEGQEETVESPEPVQP